MALKRKEAARAETLSAVTITRAEAQRKTDKKKKQEPEGKLAKGTRKGFFNLSQRLCVSASLREMALLEIALRERE
jgi:hypothetical protein